MHGNNRLYRNNEKDNKQARQFYREAIGIDKKWAMPYVMLGFTHVQDLYFGWSKSPLDSFVEAENNAEIALSLNDSLDQAHGLIGYIYLFKQQYDEAIKAGERAIDLNPNGADAHAHLGLFTFFGSDNVQLSIKLLRRAFRLNPIPPPNYYHYLGTAYRIIGQYEKAIELAKKCLSGNPDQLEPYLLLAVSYTMLSRDKDAQKAAEDVLRISPNFSIERISALPYRNKNAIDEALNALRKAGLPD